MKTSSMTYVEQFGDVLREIEKKVVDGSTMYIDGDKTLLMSGKILKNIYNRNPTLRFSIRNTIKGFTIDESKYYIDPNAYKFLKTCSSKFKRIVVVTSRKDICNVDIKKISVMDKKKLVDEIVDENTIIIDFGTDMFFEINKGAHIFKITSDKKS